MHKHEYTYTGFKGKELIFTCNKFTEFDKRCNHQVTREATNEEYNYVIEDIFGKDQNNDVHFVAKQFVDIINKYKDNEREKELDNLIQKYPNYLNHSTCDDDMFMSADIYYIQHKTPSKIMGVSVYIIFQDNRIFHYFLYPGHIKSMFQILRNLQEEFTDDKFLNSMISNKDEKIKYIYD